MSKKRDDAALRSQTCLSKIASDSCRPDHARVRFIDSVAAAVLFTQTCLPACDEVTDRDTTACT
jgi:hypothetical protein